MTEGKRLQFSTLEDITALTDKEVEEKEKQEQDAKDAEKRAVLESHYRDVAPYRYRAESLETFKAAKETERAYLWVCGFAEAVEKKNNTKNIVYLNGKSGTGKTHLALGLLRRLGGRMLTSLELCITYDSCRDFTAKQTRIEFLKNICAEKVLIIDEVGKGIEKLEAEILPYIVNEFYNDRRKVLVFTGNESNEIFNKIIGVAGADRMRESGVYLTLGGESNRGAL